MKMCTKISNLSLIGDAVNSMTMLGFNSITIELIENSEDINQSYYYVTATTDLWEVIPNSSHIGYTVDDF